VSLKVYDVAGRLVDVLVDEARPAGVYTETWNGRDRLGNAAASGVYFCRIVAGDLVRTRKMVLLR
jgi:flagellar hook assembly protein FlgD